jgi:hypothetical protein
LLIDSSSSWVQKPILQGGPFFRGKTNTTKDILRANAGKGLAREKSIMQELSMAIRDKKRHLRRLRGKP